MADFVELSDLEPTDPRDPKSKPRLRVGTQLYDHGTGAERVVTGKDDKGHFVAEAPKATITPEGIQSGRWEHSTKEDFDGVESAAQCSYDNSVGKKGSVLEQRRAARRDNA